MASWWSHRRTQHVVWRTLAFLAVAASARTARAQNVISVPFTNGFIGNRGSSAGSSNAVLTFATLGITRAFFIQSSSSSQFELQGNDIPGTLRIVRANGTTLDIAASANWRNSGGTTYLIGILPRPTSPITFAYSGGSIQITDGASPGGSSVGAYIAAYAGAVLADGANASGNAAQAQVLSGLNSYLSTVVASRPAGPVTVTTLTTASTTPTLTGTATLGAGESISVVVNGVQYSATSSPAVSSSAGTWSLGLTTALAVGTYSVTATITNADGFTLSDATSNELVITQPALTIAGSFTANGKVYDGTTAATGNTSGLTLVGVNGGDQVTIASATMAYQSNSVGPAKTVVLTAVTLGGANAAQYSVSLTGAPTATAAITAKGLTISGLMANNKTYDGTTSATLAGTASYGGLVNGESFAATGTPIASFGTPGVGVSKAVTVTGYTAPSANYTVTQPAGLTANVTAKSLTIGGSFTAADKVADGSAAATIVTNSLTLPGVVGSDVVALTGIAAAFANAAVGNGKTVSLTTASLMGAEAVNYSLSLVGAPTTTANITAGSATPVTIAGSFTASNKTYDATTAATGNTSGLMLVGVNPAHQVNIASVTLAFQAATAGTGVTVSIAGVTLGGTDAASYSVDLAAAPQTTATIFPKALTIVGVTAVNKTYDGSTTATLTGAASYSGLVAGETFAVVGAPCATFATSAVANGIAVTVSSYDAPNTNYTVTQPSGLTANIVAKPLTIGGSFTAADKVADGTTSATIVTNSLTLPDVVGGDVVSLTGVAAAFANATVGNGKLVSLTAASLSGADAANYSLSLVGAPTTTASITTAGGTVTVAGTFTATDKVYDRTVAATGNTSGLSLNGVNGGDQVSIASVTLAFQTTAIGTAKAVVITAVTLSGADAAHYTASLTSAPTATAAITAKQLTIGGTFAAANKQYDGNTSASISTNNLTLVGVESGDVVSLSSVVVAFATPTIGNAKPVAIMSASLTGAAAGNYTLSMAGAPTSVANITSANPPSAPTDVTASAGDGSLTISWSPPAVQGCSAVSSYTVQYSADQGATWTAVAVQGNAMFVTISGVTNNTPYVVRVSASNSCGMGPYASAPEPVWPTGPTRDKAGRTPTSVPGKAYDITNGVSKPLVPEVVQDTVVRLDAGDLSLRVRAKDQPGAVIPVDSSATLELESGGSTVSEGTGFKPGTRVAIYLIAPDGTPRLLGQVVVALDGSFATTLPLPEGLTPGNYTLQVNGVDKNGRARSLGLGVEVDLPPADLDLTATPDQSSPAVGDTITITLTVTNQGRGPAIDVVIPRAFTEPGFTIVRTTPLDGTYNAARQEWSIPRIDPAANARLLLTVIVIPPGAPQEGKP